MTVTLGGNYNFGVLTAYGSFQYFDNALSVGQKYVTDEGGVDTADATHFANGAEGWSVGLGVGVPLFGGTAKAAAGYVSAEDTEVSSTKLDRWNGRLRLFTLQAHERLYGCDVFGGYV